MRGARCACGGWRVSPSLPLTAWDPNELNQEHNWLQAAANRAGEPREVIVWVAECSSGWMARDRGQGLRHWSQGREQFLYPRGLAPVCRETGDPSSSVRRRPRDLSPAAASWSIPSRKPNKC